MSLPYVCQHPADKGQGQLSGSDDLEPALLPTIAGKGKGWGNLSLAHVTSLQTSDSVSSPMIILSGLVCCHLCHQGQLYCAVQVRYRACSPECCIW